MQVSELIELLETYPPNYQVVLSRDAEGNGFSPLCDADAAAWDEKLWDLKYVEDEDDPEYDSVILWPA